MPQQKSSAQPEFAPHPDWPAQRDLSRYEHLIGFSIRDKLSAGGLYLDIGPGTHAVALRPLDNLPGVSLAVLTTDSVDVAGTQIVVEHGKMPSALDVIARYAHRCAVITDIFASTTYSDDPAVVLAAISFLPAESGTVGIFTELDKFGAIETWREISLFFREQTGQNVNFEKFRIKGDAEPIWVDCLRISISGAHNHDVSHLPILKEELEKRLGKPSIGRTIWKTSDGRATISEINYEKFPAPPELMRISSISKVS